MQMAASDCIHVDDCIDLPSIICRVGGASLERCKDLTEDIGHAAQDALQRIHDLGIAHGDVALSNFLLASTSPQVEVVIVDLGLASFADAPVREAEQEELVALFADEVAARARS